MDLQFQQEVQQLHHQRVYSILLVAIGVMLLFTALDYLLLKEHFFEFLRYRLGSIAVVGLLVAANFFDRKHRRTWAIGFTGYLLSGCVVLLTIHREDGVTSPYYVGLIVAMTIYTALAPLTVMQTLISGFSLVGIYLISMTMIGPLSDYELVSLFSNLFFMICFVFIAATQSWADTSARKNEYLLRQEEHRAQEQLNQQAGFLEQEVKRRTEEQQAVDQRFRLLYEAIVDDVVLVTAHGRILQANQSFVHHFYGGTLPSQASLFDMVPTNEHTRVRQELLRPLKNGAVVSAWHITLLSHQQNPLEVEISGTLLVRGEQTLGLQLVLRDIGIRQDLEQKLIASLDRIRQTENAAILALAKLSEYRDVTPGNHLERIREYCRLLAMELAHRPGYGDTLTPNFIQNLYQGCILHDIGKVAVPDSILGKEGAYTSEEEALLRQHTTKGGEVIGSMMESAQCSGFLAIARNIALAHHERWDGQGYPQGWCGTEIPIEARIMAVADAYEELTAALSPGKRVSHAQAVQAIIDGAGGQFDPTIVEALQLIQDSLNRVRLSLAEPAPPLSMESSDCNQPRT
jgi:response regulator RpfG family c-di-GMP phosphodiesterase